MDLQWTPFTLPIAIAAGLLCVNSAYLLYRWRQEPSIPGIGLGAGLVTCFAFTLVFYVFELSVSSASMKLIFNQIQYLGWAHIGGFLVGYVLVYTGREQLLDRKMYVLLFLPSVLTVVFVLTNDVHWLYWRDFYIETINGYAMDVNVFGPLFYWYIFHIYAFVLIGLTLLAKAFIETRGSHRWQIAGLMIGIAAPAIGGVIYVSGFVPRHYPVAPYVACIITAIAFTWPVVRHDLFTILPIARRTVIEQMDDGMLVCDEEETIIDVNPAVLSLFDREADEILGRSLWDVLDPMIDDTVDDAVDETSWQFDADGGMVTIGETVVDLSVSPITRSEEVVGTVVTFRNVTDLVEYRYEIERQNEQLEQFASVVSHDLRNPLTVVNGWVDLAEEQDVAVKFDSVRRALDRMDQLIQELLSLARAGETVRETEPTEIADVAQLAWGSVGTKDATLTMDINRTIDADPHRLQQVFENLFRNSIEHGGDDVSVVVREAKTGFTVEDDGPGISPELGDRIFEWGFSSTSNGTGYGLSIVEQIVDAHGWTIRADPTGSENGGALFEIRGVTTILPSEETTVPQTATR